MDDRRLPVLVVSILLLVFASVFVGLYLVSCLFVVKKVRLSDYLMLLAWVSKPACGQGCSNLRVYKVLDFGFVFSLLFAVRSGFGLHGSDLTPENRIIINKSIYVFNILYVSFCLFPNFWKIGHGLFPVFWGQGSDFPVIH